MHGWNTGQLARKVRHNINQFIKSNDWKEKDALLDELLELTEFIDDYSQYPEYHKDTGS